MRLNQLVAIILIATFSFSAAALDKMQFHLRLGMVKGSFTGAETGEFSNMTSFDGEAEYLWTAKASFSARAIFTVDPESAQVQYMYAGGGQRFYIFSRASGAEATWGFDTVTIKPKLRYFVGWDLGMAQVLLQRVTESLSVQSAVLEYGGTAGLIYQLTSGLGMEIAGGVSKGIGISTVAVDTTILKLLIGLTFN